MVIVIIIIVVVIDIIIGVVIIVVIYFSYCVNLSYHFFIDYQLSSFITLNFQELSFTYINNLFNYKS